MSQTNNPHVESLLAQQDWLRSLVRDLVRDPNAAADLEQDTWLAALKAPPIHAGGGRAWLRTVVRRLSQRTYRTNRARTEREQDVGREEVLPATVNAVAHAESIKDLVEATLALEDPFRETILLRYFENLSPSEIAEQMGVPASTVRSRLTRAHGKLRSELTGRIEAEDLSGMAWIAALTTRVRGLGTAVGGFPTFVAIGAALLVAGSLVVAFLLGALGPQSGEVNGIPALEVSLSAEEGAGLPAQAESGNGTVDLGSTSTSRLIQTSSRQRMRTEVTGDSDLAAGDTFKGNVLAPDGSPIQDALLVIKSSSPSRPGAVLRAAGDFDSEAGTSESIQLRSNSRGEFNVPARFLIPKEGQQRTGYRIVFDSAPSAAFTSTSQDLKIGSPIELRPNWQVRFAGIVRDGGTGRPVEGVRVSYGPDKLDATTDAKGYFQIAAVPGIQGRTAQFHHPDYVLGNHEISLLGKDPGVQEFSLERGIGLELVCFDSESERGVSGAVLFLDEEGLVSQACDQDGRVRLRIANQGAQCLRGECPGFANFVWRFWAEQIPDNQVLRIPMTALSIAHGTVTDSTGSMITDATVNSYPTVPTVGVVVPDLPGTLWRTLIGVRRWEASLSQAKVDSSGAFELAFLQEDGPWRVDARGSGGKRASQHVESLGETIKLVLESAPSAPDSTVVFGRLMRDGLPWGREEVLALRGPSADYTQVNPDGSFQLEGQAGGRYELIYQGGSLRNIHLEQGLPSKELGDIELDRLPRLRLRFESLQGSPLINKVVRVCGLKQSLPTEFLNPSYPVSDINARTDSKGQIDLLLPGQGDYSVILLDETPRHREVIHVSGDLERVIRLQDPRTIYLSWIHGESGGAITADILDKWAVYWRRPGERESRLVKGTVNYRGLTEFVCPAGPLELSIHAEFGGYTSQTVTQAQLVRNTSDNPLEVTLVPGGSLAIEFDERLGELLDKDIELFLVKISDLDLVRDRLPQEERVALAAMGKSIRFVDPALAMFEIFRSMGNGGWDRRGIDPGSYTVVAFDKQGRRSDLRIAPAEFEVGPEHTSIRLGLASSY